MIFAHHCSVQGLCGPAVSPGPWRTRRSSGWRVFLGRLLVAPCSPGGAGGSLVPGSLLWDNAFPETFLQSRSLFRISGYKQSLLLPHLQDLSIWNLLPPTWVFFIAEFDLTTILKMFADLTVVFFSAVVVELAASKFVLMTNRAPERWVWWVCGPSHSKKIGIHFG